MNYTISLFYSFTKKVSFVRIFFIITGFIPVSCIALHVLQIFPLHQTAFFLAIPGFLFMLLLGLKYGKEGNIALQGWLAGIVAVALYDIARVPFIWMGWNDFVPHIGDWILNKEGNNGLIAYLWRYMGNGGGMGISFILLMKKGIPKSEYVRKGILYGLFIFSNLILTLIISANGQKMMFEITVLNFIGSLFGHIIYGLVLGWFINFYLRKKSQSIILSY